MNTYMVLARLFFLLTFILLHQVSWAQEDPKPGNIFGLYEVADQISQQSILEFWGYHDNDGGGVYDNTLKLRYYQPLSISDWKGTLRLDTSYVSTYGVNQPNQFAGQYSAGTTMLTIWGNPPDILQKWGGTVGARIIFPFGSSGQWAIGPQVATSYKPSTDSKSPLSDFSPLVRYMYGFSSSSTASSSNPTPLLRSLYLFPTVGINLSPSTQIRFWDENGMVYNTAGGGWFVPLDAMITQRLSKHTLIAIGASKQLIQTYQQYNWSIYGKLSMNF